MAEPVQRVNVPIDDPDSHPIAIGVCLNEQMQRWDLDIMIGNYKTPEEAQAEADRLRALLEDYFDTDLARAK